MSKKHPRRQLPAFDSVRIGTKRRVHPALPSAVPRVRKSTPVCDDTPHDPQTPESKAERRQRHV
jgi:hypothetical protein